MDAERWRRIETLYHAAMERDGEERLAFLAQACPDDETRRQVEALIRSGESSRLIDQAIQGAVDERADRAGGLAAGTRIGPYRLVERIGVGGMGAVWLAERSDEHFKKRVALKLIKRGMDSEEILARFRRERQVLANLQHTNVAALFDGGATDDGLPYLVMEHVDGAPIDAYCDGRRMPVDERLRLFRKVCAAVHHAHRNLVVHRDLKPGNILVTDDGQPKLLDFGIAKMLGADDQASMGLTATSARLLTPRYASPEQLRGEAITTASDVYQLGLILYELLTGRLAHPVSTADPAALARIVCEQPPTRPSLAVTHSDRADDPDTERSSEAIAAARGTDVDRLRRRLAGDLDAILLAALRKEPERRHASAEHLSADIRRHLEGQPVLARPESWRYRASRFARRHRLAVAAAAATVGALVLGIAGTTAAMLRALRAEQVARTEAEQARAVTDFLVDVFRVSDPSEARGSTVTAKEILDRGAAEVGRELSDQPAIQARLTATIGSVYEGLGLVEDAAAMLAEAVRLHGRTSGSEHPDTLRSQHQLAVNAMNRGRHEEAERLLEATLEGQRRAQGGDHAATLRTQDNLASLYWRTGRLDEAEALFVDTLTTQRRALGHDHPHTLMTMQNLGILYTDLRRLDEAEALYAESLLGSRRVHGDDHPVTLKAMHNLGMLLKTRRRFDEAEALLLETLAAKRRVLGDEHATTLTSMAALANVYYDREQHEVASELWGETLAISRRINGDEHPTTYRQADNLALAYHELGRWDEAEALYVEVLAGRQRLLGAEHPEVGITAHNLANLRRDTGAHAAAQSLYERAQAIFEQHYGGDHPYVAENLDQHAELMRLMGDEATAARMADRARAIRR